MAVLMRKPELVKRYSCVLQILESTIDLQNDDKLVSEIKCESSVYCINLDSITLSKAHYQIITF